MYCVWDLAITVKLRIITKCCCTWSDLDMYVCVLSSAAGYVWAYNTMIYYQNVGTADETIAWYMSWIPLVWGCVGVTLGGFVSDRVVSRLGPYARLAVLIASQASSFFRTSTPTIHVNT